MHLYVQHTRHAPRYCIPSLLDSISLMIIFSRFISLSLYNIDGGHDSLIGWVENQKSWKITKPQVDPIDAHKNKTICIIKKCFVSITPLENAKIGSTWPL